MRLRGGMLLVSLFMREEGSSFGLHLDQMPDIDQLAKARPLRLRRFRFNGQIALHSSRQEYANDLEEFRHIATLALTTDDHELAAQNRSYGSWSIASIDAEGEWRWAFDREAILHEVKQVKQGCQAGTLLQREAVKGLTQAAPFGNRARTLEFIHPFHLAEFVVAARERIRKANLGDLQALGAKPKEICRRAPY